MEEELLGWSLVFFGILLIAIYFIPSIIAFARGSAYAWVIFVLNLMGGWTVIAWFAAFIWALWPKGHSAASIDVNLNHRGAVNLGPLGYPAPPQPMAHNLHMPMGYAPNPALPQHSNSNVHNPKLDALERLAHLRTIGAISYEEFEQQKAILLREY